VTFHWTRRRSMLNGCFNTLQAFLEVACVTPF
jgi:hypothetical protein